MRINRQNYETFFLLYADNELSATERKAVEEFVDVNPDLAEELQALLDVILPAEISPVHFKEQLFKKEIELDSLQENMLMQLDGELDAASSKKLQLAIQSDANLEKEWGIWQQTKLNPNEQVVFNDKQSLYRKEEGRVVSISYWRIAVAAAVLLFGLFVGINYFKKQETAHVEFVKHESSTDKKNETGSNNAVKDQTPISQTVTEENSIKAENEQHTAAANPAIHKQAGKQSQTVEEKSPVNSLNNQEKSIALQPTEKKQKQVTNPERSLENINNKKSNEATASTVITNKGTEITEVEKIPEQQLASTTTDKKKVAAPSRPVIDYNSIPPMETNSYAKTASFSDNDPGNDSKVLYMNEETVNRTKLGGFFRKVKRTIERNTSVKTGNGIKIAGFEFASK